MELGAFTFVFSVFYSGVLFGELGFFVVVLLGFGFFLNFFPCVKFQIKRNK